MTRTMEARFEGIVDVVVGAVFAVVAVDEVPPGRVVVGAAVPDVVVILGRVVVVDAAADDEIVAAAGAPLDEVRAEIVVDDVPPLDVTCPAPPEHAAREREAITIEATRDRTPRLWHHSTQAISQAGARREAHNTSYGQTAVSRRSPGRQSGSVSVTVM